MIITMFTINGFTSLGFLVFFIIVLFTLSFVKKQRIRVIFILLANLIFYSLSGGWIAFVFLILYIWLIYGLSYLLKAFRNKVVLTISIVLSIVPLLLLKYLTYYLGLAGIKIGFFNNIGLPLGLSFFTLQAISYLAEIYKRSIEFEKNPIYLGIYLSLFSIVTSGPIESPNHIISQLKKDYEFDYDKTVVGLRYMGIGLFLKLFIADSLGYIVDIYYSDPGANYYSIMLLVSTIFFAFQLYADFCGYSLMAKGSADSIGIDVIDNFHQPYISSSVSSFWSRWHVSFQRWLTKYIYIPLGGSRVNTFRVYLNILIVFLVSGFWHGSGFTFLIWGALNALFLIVERLLGWNSKEKAGARRVIGFIYTIVFIGFSWIFFRANSVTDAFIIIKQILVNIPKDLVAILTHRVAISSFFSTHIAWLLRFSFSIIGIILIILLDVRERRNGPLAISCSNWKIGYRFLFYISLICIAVGLGMWGTYNEFMYAQF